MPGYGQITPAQTMRLIGTPDAPLILDVRPPEDLAALPRLVPTSRILPHTAIATLTTPPARAIVVCQRGRKLSEGAAAVLRCMGWQAEVLAVAEKFKARPFDIEGASFSHRGDGCSLDALLDGFGLQSEALDRWARNALDEGHDWPAGRSA